jgi:hypothetical protein
METLTDFLGSNSKNYTHWKEVYSNEKTKKEIITLLAHKIDASEINNFNSFRKKIRPILQNVAEKIPEKKSANETLQKEIKNLFSKFPRPLVFLGEYESKINEYLK